MTDDVTDVLQEIGLTQYQSRAYLAAVRLGTARFSALAEESDIPKQRIYDVVDDLAELGLVEVREGADGKEAVAIPPDQGLNELKAQRFDRFEANVETAVDELSRRFSEVDASTGFVTVVNHESSARRHAANAIESAYWWLFLSLPLERYREFREEIRDAVARGVTVRLLVQGEDADAVENAEYPEGMLVRHRPSADVVVAADRAYGMFRGVGGPALSRPSLVTDNANMVEMFRRYSEQFWTASRDLRTANPYPRRYLSPWQALVDHAHRLDDGEAFAVSLEGHDTDSGRVRTVEGRIVDYELRPEGGFDYSVVLPEVARLVVETDDGRLTVGGWDARLEDVAAHGLEIRRA